MFKTIWHILVGFEFIFIAFSNVLRWLDFLIPWYIKNTTTLSVELQTKWSYNITSYYSNFELVSVECGFNTVILHHTQNYNAQVQVQF
jgi:hypothetical protein